MPAPATSTEFLDLVRKSGLVEANRLNSYLQQKKATLPPKPVDLANAMIRDEMLTSFQTEQLLQGKFRGFNIGKYRLLGRLGAGGMASVYLGERIDDGSRVAIKILPKARAEDPEMLKRFHREGRVITSLDHPNVVRAYEMDRDDKGHFLVMEYIEGVSLQDVVKKQGPLGIIQASKYIHQAASGLNHLHEAGLVHRDIKPGNLLLDRGDTVKLFDMGLARFFEEDADVLTRGVIGTADYIAPEQSRDSHTVDIRADIYSLGGTFYYLLTGRIPFGEGGTVAQKLIAHRTKQPEPIRKLRPDIPEALAEIVNTMMAKDPEERYQTPAEVLDALDSWV